MLEQLTARVAALLRRPRVLKPQTQRQLAPHLAEHAGGANAADLPAFLLCAADVLQDYELDIVFGPSFTPTLDERAEVADFQSIQKPNQVGGETITKRLMPGQGFR